MTIIPTPVCVCCPCAAGAPLNAGPVVGGIIAGIIVVVIIIVIVVVVVLYV